MTSCLRICTAASCRSRGSQELHRHCNGPMTAHEVGCLGPCSDGPLAVLEHNGQERLLTFASAPANAADLAASLNQAYQNHALERWLPAGVQELAAEEPFLQLQRRLVLAHCGVVDPGEIASARALGAYEQLARVLADNEPAAVIEMVRRSGLRGRGGAGYPTGLKWATVAAMPPGEKVVVCNADEGDPGAFMDRTVMEGDPHTLLEGIAIAAFAVGAQSAYIYVRAEYPLAIERLRRAIQQAQQEHWLGQRIAGSGFNLELQLRVGAGAYVCGEETALIHSIEGQRGVPRPRPPYPAERGVFERPTLINNVETLANLPALLRLGVEAYGKGTKVFSLTGHVRRSGVLEVPMGTSLRTIVETMGGGTPSGAPIKAVQTGGPSGGCVPGWALDTPVDYESLRALGTIMGSGGMVVMDPSTNMVDLAAFFMAFCREESCGKCIPCRCGTVQLELLLRKLLKGQGSSADLQQLEELCHTVQDASLCGLGQSAPNPVLSTLRHFRKDYEALVSAP